MAGSDRFLTDYGVSPRPILPLLTRSGAIFEQAVAAAVGERYQTLNLAEGEEPLARSPDNARLATFARELATGETLVVLQPRIEVELAGWRIRGDADVVRLERGEDGRLDVLIVDVKSSTAAKIEHRLQVAFYHEMLATLFAAEAIPAEIATGILYRASTTVLDRDAEQDDGADDTSAGSEAGIGARTLPPEVVAAQREAAGRLFNVANGLLELIDDPESYRDAVRDLVTGERSVARTVAATPFEQIPVPPDLQVRRLPLQRVLHEVERRARRPLAAAPPHGAGEERACCDRASTRVDRVAHLKDPRRDEATGKEDLTQLAAGARQRGAGPAARGELAGRAAAGRADPPRPLLPAVQAGRAVREPFLLGTRPSPPCPTSRTRATARCPTARPITIRTWFASTSTPSTTTSTTASTCSARWSPRPSTAKSAGAAPGDRPPQRRAAADRGDRAASCSSAGSARRSGRSSSWRRRTRRGSRGRRST